MYLFPGIIWKGPNQKKNLYLTFDDGPGTGTLPILDILKSKGVKASFFLLGSQMEMHPELVERILDDGHQIANHSYLHSRGKEMESVQYLEGANQTRALLNGYQGQVKSHFFRPPYGQMTFRQYRSLVKEGFKIAMYSLMPGDFDASISDEECLQRLKALTKAGDIIVLHDNQKSMNRLVKILPQYIDYCLSRGFQFDLLP
ncbi:polysaccharide deacetylase family protein [Reichenbachiella ulvae]|uniref:Polysaccharide deacetylase family protein n=1 Tax=Reichenbachiella ulvae TaxID=2980104 RepID=A0ABT3CTB5_9BACT|nr:polysaccharide deacetylase family protein [Reichenbachiella ulvae]MCV9386798.1 polysaccharide deacetylase family protein [Reichenbachiella ulvae]